MMRHLMSWWKKQVEVIRLLALCLKAPHLHQFHLHKGIISRLKIFNQKTFHLVDYNLLTNSSLEFILYF